MDEYDRWYKGYMFRRRMARDAKLIGIGMIVVGATWAVITIVSAIAGILA